MPYISLKPLWQGGIRTTGVIDATWVVVGETLSSAHVYPFQFSTTPNENIFDLHVTSTAVVYSTLDSATPPTARVKYVNPQAFDIPPVIESVGGNFIRLYGVPGDKRFYTVRAAALPHTARFYKSETDTGMAVTFPTTPTDHGSIEALYIFRNVGYASTKNYPLLRSELGVPTNFAHAESIFDFGYSEQLALCDGFEPYALIPAGAYWVNWGAKSYARFFAHHPTASPIGGVVSYNLLAQRFMASKNGAFFVTSLDGGIFLENREIVRAAPGLASVLAQVARVVGRTVKLYPYVNAHFPYWAILLANAPIGWESGAYTPVDFSTGPWATTDVRSVLLAGDVAGVRCVVPLAIVPTGHPYVYNANVLLPIGPRVYAWDLTSGGLFGDLFTGGLLETEVPPVARIVFQPRAEWVGMRIRRVIFEGRNLRTAEINVIFTRGSANALARDLPVSGATEPVARATGLAWSDGMVVAEVLFPYQGEVLEVEVRGNLPWMITDVVLDIEPAFTAPTKAEPYVSPSAIRA